MLRKGVTFNWTKQCENAFKLLKELAKMPSLQYPNPNTPFQLFTDTSKHSYSRILHQEKEGQPNAGKPELILITYFSGTFNKKHNNFGTLHRRNVMQSINRFKNSLSISQVQTAHYTVITNPFLYDRYV